MTIHTLSVGSGIIPRVLPGADTAARRRRLIRKRRLSLAGTTALTLTNEIRSRVSPMGIVACFSRLNKTHRLGSHFLEIYCSGGCHFRIDSASSHLISSHQTSLTIWGVSTLSIFTSRSTPQETRSTRPQHGSSHPRRGPTDAKGSLQLASIRSSMCRIMGSVYDRI
jgi:hypothetical protein